MNLFIALSLIFIVCAVAMIFVVATDQHKPSKTSTIVWIVNAIVWAMSAALQATMRL